MKTMTIPELHGISSTLSNKDLILDVRTPQEFAAGHIPGSKHIPFDQVAHHIGELQNHDNIYVYCKMGGRAYAACEVLEAMKIKNLTCIVDGGFPDWAAAGHPFNT